MFAYFLSPSGRIGRGKWWLGQLFIIVILILGFMSVGVSLDPNDKEKVALVPLLILLTMVVAVIWFNLVITIKRYHDRNKSGWWYFFGFIPLIGPIWQFIELGFLSGDVDDNEFGPGPGFDISDDIERLAGIQSPTAKPAWQPVGITPAKLAPEPAFGQPPKPMFGSR